MKLTKSRLEQIVKEAIVEAGGMRMARLGTSTGAIAAAREAAKKVPSPEEKKEEEKKRLARLAKFGHLYDPPSDVKESQDDEPITSEAAVREPTHEGTCASAHPNILSHEEWAKAELSEELLKRAKETPSGRLHKEGAMKLTKSRLKQIIGEEVATVLLERDYDDVWEDEKGQWWVQDDEGNKRKIQKPRGVGEGIEADPMAPSGVNQQEILKDVIAFLKERGRYGDGALGAFLATLRRIPDQQMNSPSVKRSLAMLQQAAGKEAQKSPPVEQSQVPEEAQVQRENNMKLTKSKLKQIIEEEISGDPFPGAGDIDD